MLLVALGVVCALAAALSWRAGTEWSSDELGLHRRREGSSPMQHARTAMIGLAGALALVLGMLDLTGIRPLRGHEPPSEYSIVVDNRCEGSYAVAVLNLHDGLDPAPWFGAAKKVLPPGTSTWASPGGNRDTWDDTFLVARAAPVGSADVDGAEITLLGPLQRRAASDLDFRRFGQRPIAQLRLEGADCPSS